MSDNKNGNWLSDTGTEKGEAILRQAYDRGLSINSASIKDLAINHIESDRKSYLQTAIQDVKSKIAKLEEWFSFDGASTEDRRRVVENQWKADRPTSLVKSYDDALNYSNSYSDYSKFKFSARTVIIGALFLGEFLMGYFIFKNFVLPDEGFSNHLISVLIGLVIVFAGYFMKHLPDKVESIKKYKVITLILDILSIVSLLIFLIILSSKREMSDSFNLLTATIQQPGQSRLIEAVFQFSLLSFLIFASSSVHHFKKAFPFNKALADSKDLSSRIERAIAGSHGVSVEELKLMRDKNAAELKDCKNELSELTKQEASCNRFVKDLRIAACQSYIKGIEEGFRMLLAEARKEIEDQQKVK